MDQLAGLLTTPDCLEAFVKNFALTLAVYLCLYNLIGCRT